MDDFISRKALAEWVHANVPANTPDALITKSFVMAALSTKRITPSVPAVPLDKLCEWLEGAEKEGLCCLDCANLLRNKSFVTKWMERLDGSESMV